MTEAHPYGIMFQKNWKFRTTGVFSMTWKAMEARQGWSEPPENIVQEEKIKA